MSRRTVIVAAVVALALSVWGYSAYHTHSTRLSIISVVKDASEKLRPALHARDDGHSDFGADARAVDAHVKRVRAMGASSLVELADAADAYLVTAREILRRQAAMQSARDALEASLEALSRHRAAGRGAADWARVAVRLKEKVDRDLREFRVGAESYASLVATLPQAQAKIAPHVNAAWLADENTITAARNGALDALARTDENTRQATRLDAHRGTRARP